MSNLCLLNTSGIRAAAENAQRIISDKDVGGSTQQQVFREKNLLLNSVHGRTLFNKPAINLCSRLVSASSIFKKLTERAPNAFVMLSLVEKDRLQHPVLLAPIFIDAHL